MVNETSNNASPAGIGPVPTRWRLPRHGQDGRAELQNALGCSALLAELLLNRGIADPDSARRFLSPSLSDLHSPWLMADMARTVDRIWRAIEQQEPILIYGDYDVDGVTSVVILKKIISMLGGRVSYFVPRRFIEGYGLHEERLKEYAAAGIRLIVSVDSGIRAFSVCELAHQLGVELVITDHHLPDRALPRAYAILNPRRPDCAYPDKELAGVGVTFKLVQALLERSGKTHLVPSFLKVVSIGTIADVVPLQGENRILVAHGLRGLSNPVNVGLRALLRSAGLDGKQICFEDVGFRIAPRINALGRLGDSREAIELFDTSDAVAADAVAARMAEQNRERQAHEMRMLADIEERFGQRLRTAADPVVVVSGQGWHAGVAGIVASRLVESYYRPVLVIALDGETGRGSGRSIAGFHLLEALESCGSLFEKFGGHAQAVGFTLPASEVARLTESLQQYALPRLKPDLLCREVAVDAIIEPEQIGQQLLEQIALLAPFGYGNPVPCFASQRVTALGGASVLKEKHLKFRVGSTARNFEAIWWKHASLKERLDFSRAFDVVYTLTESEYRGIRSILWQVVDVRQ